MLRSFFARPSCIASLVCLMLVSSLMASCGGGGKNAAKDMALVEYLLVDRALAPVAATGTDNLPRNAQILMVFSELVNPNSVNNQTIQMRFGPAFQSVPKGSFSVSANTVRFDPTVTADGQPNPFGFDPVTQYTLDIPSWEEQQDVVQNADFDPNLTTFFTTFTTSDGFLRELVPPQITGVGFVPGPDAVTGNVPGDGLMFFDFSEPMAPGSFIQAPFNGPDTGTTIDVRYTTAAINTGAGLTTLDASSNPIGTPVPGTYTPAASATRYFFRPTFSFGDQKFEFFAEVFQGLKDLSGNLLVNPRSFGPFTCDGLGQGSGKVIQEDFLDNIDRDAFDSDADWNSTTEGTVQGQAISSRKTYLFGYQHADDFGAGANSGRGQYAPIADPLSARNLNDVVSGISPPTSDGRRVMWAFDDTEMGPSGSVTEVAWGPDSNATFAASYDVILRMGYQKDSSLALGTTFSGNYQGSPAVVFTGQYSVAQLANVGNTTGHPVTTHAGGYNQNPGCTTPANWNSPLYSATGFYSWPALTNFFEWDAGSAAVEGDSVFLFEVSAEEGATDWQQFRAWFAVTYPCSGVLIGGFPGRRLYATYEEDTANPEENFTAGILNPEPTVMDTCITITKRVSIAQSLFFFEAGNPVQAAHGNTFGDNSKYLPAEITPSVQVGGASVVIEFQGADNVDDADRRTIIESGDFTPWTRNISDCDGHKKIRYRLQLISNLVSQEVAKVTQVRIPLVSN